MQCVLKMQQISLLPKHKKLISGGVFLCLLTHLNKSLLKVHIFLHLTVSPRGRNTVNSVPNSCGPSTMNSVLQAPHNLGSITEILSLILTQFKPLGRGE